MPEGKEANETLVSKFRKGIGANLFTAAATGVAGGIIAALGAAWTLVVTVPGRVGLVPPGAVAAFDLKDGCPAGWTAYDKGAGRFIIGAASRKELDKIPGPFARDARGADISERSFDVPGGEQQHMLTLAEMPSHSHRLYRNDGSGGNGLYPSSEKMGSNAPQNVADTLPSGGGQAHNIMPPYVALWLCKKD